MGKWKLPGAKGEGGYTFLEMILVLAVLSIMTALIVPVGDRWITARTEEDAIQELVASIYELQAYAMANQVFTRLEFRESENLYVLNVPGKYEIRRTKFPDGMNYTSSSNLYTVDFHANGDIRKFGTITIKTSKGLTNIHLQMVRGRMNINER